MDSKEFLTDEKLQHAFDYNGWGKNDLGELRLIALELALKANASYYSSHTEEGALRMLGLLKKDRTLNKKGRGFVAAMIYNHSSKRPECFELMLKHRV